MVTLTKKEIRIKLNVSHTTLSYYLNRRYFKKLQNLGYVKNQKILTPLQVKYLCDVLGLDLKDSD